MLGVVGLEGAADIAEEGVATVGVYICGGKA